MEKTVIRIYDREDEYSMMGKCYFLVLKGTWDELSGLEFEQILNKICMMSWQNYTSYAVGTIDDLKEEELLWSEVMDNEMYEVNVDIERVKNMKKYKLPEMFR